MHDIDLKSIEAKWRLRFVAEQDRASAAPFVAGPPHDDAEPSSPTAETASPRGATTPGGHPTRRRFYCLDMFPYPSLSGFTVNQLRGVAITDVAARFQSMRGKEVFRPFGWDSFGQAIEDEAMAAGISPNRVVARGTELMREQLETFGARIDWQSELTTSDPSYYRGTQQLFEMMRARGLAYLGDAPMKWCPNCQTSRSNEEAVDGRCVHCGTEVEGISVAQWHLRISDFAERLHQGLRMLKWPQRVKSMQRHWIGRREGYRVIFKVSSELRYESGEFPVFLRQLELLPAATYVVMAPEHPMVEEFCDELYREEVTEYRRQVLRLTDLERLAAGGEPQGLPTGAYAINPLTLKKIPIWVSKMVLPGIRFGVVLGTPAHNARHAEFARRFNLPTLQVIARRAVPLKRRRFAEGAGSPDDALYEMVNAGGYNGLTPYEASRRIRGQLDKRFVVETYTTYNLRDWVFARQRFWGEPIPIVHCRQCGAVSVPDEALPVELPAVDAIPASDPVVWDTVGVPGEGKRAVLSARVAVPRVAHRDAAPLESIDGPGETWDLFDDETTMDDSPSLVAHRRRRASWAGAENFVDVACPNCGNAAEREIDTMPQWAASCWYYLRYLDPRNSERPFDPQRVASWLPVDLCVGGIEHAILHLLYVRFFAYVLHDAGLTVREEPFRRVFNQGRLYAKEPNPARKRVATHRGDRISAAASLEKFGADALRLHLYFLGPPVADVVWSEDGLYGTRRFLRRAYRFVLDRHEKGRFVSRRVLVEKHRLIRRVTTAIRTFKLNKAVSAFMSFVKELTGPSVTAEEVDSATLRVFATLLAPFAPHMSAEMWEVLGAPGSVFDESWPEHSEELLKPVVFDVGIQVNNRLCDRIELEEELSKQELIEACVARPRVADALAGRQPSKVFVASHRLVNFVVTDTEAPA